MLRTILILTVFSLTTVMFASNPEVKKVNNLNKNQISGHIQSLSLQGSLSMAQVVLYSEESDLIKVATTDQNGNFVIDNLPTGKYYVTISHLGYKSEVVDNIVVKKETSSVKMNDLFLEDTLYNIKEVTVMAPRKHVENLTALNN